MRDSYVIFICEFDKFKKGLPIYHIDRIIAETGEPFIDGSHIVYLNGEYNGNDSIGSLINDFRALKSTDIINEELAEGVKFFKETQKGRWMSSGHPFSADRSGTEIVVLCVKQ